MNEEKTWEYQCKTFKRCPGCDKGILAEWKSHICGWGKPLETPEHDNSTPLDVSEEPIKVAPKNMRVQQIQTFISTDNKHLDNSVNLFCQEYNCFATQTHIAVTDTGLKFIAIVFYWK